MAGTILLDTNILLDYADPARPGFQDAFNLIRSALCRGVKVAVTASSLKDFYYLKILEEKRRLRAAKGEVTEAEALAIKEAAFALVDTVTSFATVISTGHNDARMAWQLRDMHGDFEDNLILAVGMRLKPLCLVTSDEALAQHAPLLAVNARRALEVIEADLGD